MTEPSPGPAPEAPTPGSGAEPVGRPATARDVLVYTAGRVALVAVLAAVLVLVQVPLLVAVLFSLIVALPLSLVFMRGRRSRLDMRFGTGLERRRQERERLRAQLKGD